MLRLLPENKPRLALRKLKGPAPFLVVGFFLILGYQNFSAHQPPIDAPIKSLNKRKPLNPQFRPQAFLALKEPDRLVVDSPISETPLQLTSLRALSEAHKSQDFDIREYAPARPDRPLYAAFHEGPFRAPEVHTGQVSDVGTVWLEREVRPLMKPLEDEWLKQVNGQLRGLFGTYKPVDGEDWPEPGDDDESPQRRPANEPDAYPGMPDFPGAPSGDRDSSTEDYFSLKAITPEDVKLTKANEVTIGFKHGTNVSCEVGGGQSKFRLSRPVSRSSSFDISHESAENRNSVGFRLSW